MVACLAFWDTQKYWNVYNLRESESFFSFSSSNSVKFVNKCG